MPQYNSMDSWAQMSWMEQHPRAPISHFARPSKERASSKTSATAFGIQYCRD
jgi:hypothetical protein